MDKIGTVISELIKNPLLALAAVGFFLFLIAGLGRWPGCSEAQAIEPSWRLGLGVTGLLVAVPSMILLVRQIIKFSTAVPRNKIKIEGNYLAENRRTDPIDISYLHENLYRLRHPEWEGVGLTDGQFYYGIYQYTDKAPPDLRGMWGAHRVRRREGGGELKVRRIDLTDRCHEIDLEGSDPEDSWILRTTDE